MTNAIKAGNYAELGLMVAKIALIKTEMKELDVEIRFGKTPEESMAIWESQASDKMRHKSLDIMLKVLTNKQVSLLDYCTQQLKFNSIN